jgi:electron transfer flavoprotein alpha subunit
MILLFAENSNGTLKKAIFEAATYAYDLAKKMGTEVAAVSVGQITESELQKLGTYGIATVYTISDNQLDAFVNTAYAAVVADIAQQLHASVVVFAQTYNSRAVAPRVAAKLDASAYSGVISLPDTNNGLASSRAAFSGKGVEIIRSGKEIVVITVKTNGYTITENPTTCQIKAGSFTSTPQMDTIAKEIVKAAEGISLTEADKVVSAGRGMKGPENWGMIEELATLIGAATACSKPTADMGWRPHHEHVGQTGIQIAPNLYIAIGISGAIQHLAGVSSSKVIVVINKDAEAPFFKIADYGIVGDLFEVVPKLIAAIKKLHN